VATLDPTRLAPPRYSVATSVSAAVTSLAHELANPAASGVRLRIERVQNNSGNVGQSYLRRTLSVATGGTHTHPVPAPHDPASPASAAVHSAWSDDPTDGGTPTTIWADCIGAVVQRPALDLRIPLVLQPGQNLEYWVTSAGTVNLLIVYSEEPV
jgi:hypothetical protein